MQGLAEDRLGRSRLAREAARRTHATWVTTGTSSSPEPAMLITAESPTPRAVA